MEDSNSKKTNLAFSVENILSNNFKRKSELHLEVEHKHPPLKSLKEDTMKGKMNFTYLGSSRVPANYRDCR